MSHSLLRVSTERQGKMKVPPCTGIEVLYRPYGPQGGVDVQLYPFMTTALEEGEGSASRPGCSLPPGKTRYPLYRRLVGSQGRSGQVREISLPTGIRSPDRPARSQQLYRLSYPAHSSDITLQKFEANMQDRMTNIKIFCLTPILHWYLFKTIRICYYSNFCAYMGFHRIYPYFFFWLGFGMVYPRRQNIPSKKII